MKIAIITFSEFNTNYGSCLQAYSLSEYLKKQGHTVRFIKYREYHDSNKNLKFNERLKNNLKIMLFKITDMRYKKISKDIETQFKIFKDMYLPHTRLYTSDEELKNNLEVYDCYICGSDQIWNLKCLGGLRRPYFLSFVPTGKLKIAYAASLGEYLFDKEVKEEVKSLLSDFEKISVRESSSVENVENILGRKIEWMVDPVFLNEREFWDAFSGDKPIIPYGYGACYFVTHSFLSNEVVSKLKYKYKVPIYNLSLNNIKTVGTSNKYIARNPKEFLNLIKNAKFVVGTSFHLMAFSIIFDIPCIIIGKPENEARVKNLLKIVGREDNFVTNIEELEQAIDTLFERKVIYKSLQKKIEEAKQFLKL